MKRRGGAAARRDCYLSYAYSPPLPYGSVDGESSRFSPAKCANRAGPYSAHVCTRVRDQRAQRAQRTRRRSPNAILRVPLPFGRPTRPHCADIVFQRVRVVIPPSDTVGHPSRARETRMDAGTRATNADLLRRFGRKQKETRADTIGAVAYFQFLLLGEGECSPLQFR